MTKKMTKKISTEFIRILKKIRAGLRVLYNTKTRSRFLWQLRKGDEKLSLDYPLNESSIVFDVGAFKGFFTEKIYKKFECNIHAFEPLGDASNILESKFKNFPKVTVNNFGLIDKNEFINTSTIGASSSIFSRLEGDTTDELEFKSFLEYIQENSIEKINFMYMNIEGSEYRLLTHIIESGFINNIDYLQIQFHNFVKNSKNLRKNIRKNLSKTHNCNFNFPFIWERWDLKDLEN